jgi:hypothetical protein
MLRMNINQITIMNNNCNRYAVNWKSAKKSSVILPIYMLTLFPQTSLVNHIIHVTRRILTCLGSINSVAIGIANNTTTILFPVWL